MSKTVTYDVMCWEGNVWYIESSFKTREEAENYLIKKYLDYSGEVKDINYTTDLNCNIRLKYKNKINKIVKDNFVESITGGWWIQINKSLP